MTQPYGLMADLHCHAWASFASIDEEGRNTRLMETINEIGRCCRTVLDAGGETVVIAGDLFHTRGNVSPSVFNPVRDCLGYWWKAGIHFLMIPGNHDLETDESNALGSSVEMLTREGVSCWNDPIYLPSLSGGDHENDGLLLIPWIKNPKTFLSTLAEARKQVGPASLDQTDVICHIGVDGTLSSMPDHGIDAKALAAFGFRRVFSGHYHHHKDFGNGVISIGAPTHQTWSDVGTKAGFLLVYPDRFVWRASHAPSFIDIQGDEEPEELPLLIDGHYVRAKIGNATAKDVMEWRAKLTSMGASGVLIQSVPASAVSKRLGVSSKSLTSLRKSVQSYCDEKGHSPAVKTLAEEVMGSVGA